MNHLQSIPLALTLMLAVTACSTSPSTEPLHRYHLGDWETEIGYTQAVRHGDLLYLSGVVSGEATMDQQVTAVYSTIRTVLERYGAGMEDIIREVVYTTDIEALKQSIETRKAFFADDAYPAASWIQIDRLFMPTAMIEVEAVVRLRP